mgnify:CR=1 FL=1
MHFSAFAIAFFDKGDPAATAAGPLPPVTLPGVRGLREQEREQARKLKLEMEQSAAKAREYRQKLEQERE